MRLESPELLFDLRAALLQREQLLAQELRATTMSIAVVSPSTKAKPRTLPTDRKYKTAAARIDTKSAASRVRRAMG